jgi:hypothetical protein
MMSSAKNQPTKMLPKGKVKLRREMTSFPEFDHSCELNALLENVNVALKNWVMFYYNGVVSRRKCLEFQAMDIAASRELILRKTCGLPTGFWFDELMVSVSRSCGVAMAERVCDLGGGALRGTAYAAGKAGHSPFRIYLCIYYTTEGKTENFSQGSQVATALNVALT